MRRKRQYLVVYFTFLVLIGKRGTVFTEKKSKTVTPSRRLQATQKAKRSTLQTGKYTKIMRKIYHSFRFNDKNAFRKLDIYIYFFDISTVCTGVSAYMDASLLIYNPFLFRPLPLSNSHGM